MKKISILATIYLVYSHTGFCNGTDAMSVRAELLATTLNIPTTSSSQVWTESFFSKNEIITTNSFVIMQKDDIQEGMIYFEISSNKQTVATGFLFENNSFIKTRDLLLYRLVMNTMPIQLFIAPFEVKTNFIGDFCIIGKNVENENEDLLFHSVLHFVRGVKGISLYGKDGFNVQPIAEMLDELLKNPPASP